MIKKIIRKVILREKADSESYVKFLRKKGVYVGKDVTFYAPSKNLIDTSQPCLLTIGDHVRITHGVIILIHDYSWSVLKNYGDEHLLPGRILGAQAPVKIGNNVFIGMNAVITRGVTIGDNVIIGAGSIVTKDCEPDSLYAGNPARRIMSLEEFRNKRQQKQFEEARVLARCYYERYNKKPDENVFREYFMLFYSAEEAIKNPDFKYQMETSLNYDETIEYMNANKPMFESFEEFLNACFVEE